MDHEGDIMRIFTVAAATAALLAGANAQAITYVGHLTAGTATADVTFKTDGTLGALGTSNFTNISATITTVNSTVSFASANLLGQNGYALTATATELTYEFVTSAYFVAAFLDTSYALICFAGGIFTCSNDPGSAFLIGTDYFTGDYDFVAGNGPLLVATAVPGVPEPTSWAMLIAGFGLTGAALRRRKSARVAA